MITVFGSTNLDQIGRVPRLPNPGETVKGQDFSVAAGGKGANQALAARRAGAEVRHVSAVGADSFADAALQLLDADGVDLSGVRRVSGPTGIAMILVDDAGENIIAILPGANGTVSAADAEAALGGMSAGDVLLVQQEVPQEATERALRLAAERNVLSILNTAPFLSNTPELAKLASIVVSNESEFALMAGVGGDLDKLMEVWAETNRQTLIVTLGAQGARAATPAGSFAVPALPITPVDTVGAGDTFCGYLAAGLEGKLDLEEALDRAVIAASLACLKSGAQPAIPYVADVEGELNNGSR